MKSFFKKLYSYLYFQSWNYGLWTPPDRKFLQNQILPYFARQRGIQTILFVGVRRYTNHYARQFQHARFITIDNDPGVQKFGAKTHIVDDIRAIGQWTKYFPQGLDLIVLNGVIGFGLDDPQEVDQTIAMLSSHLRPGGQLLLGTNPLGNHHVLLDKVQSLESYYVPTSLGREGAERYTFSFPLLPGARHEYRFFKLRDSARA